MTAYSKYWTATSVAIVAVLGAAQGFALIASAVFGGHTIIPGAILLFVSVSMGVVAAVFRTYYKARRELPADQQKVAVETLSKITDPKDIKQNRWHS